MYLHYVYGASLSHVGRQFGISSAQVKHRFTQAGLSIRDPNEAVRVYNAGGNELADQRFASYLESLPLGDPAAPSGVSDADSEVWDDDLEWRVVALHGLDWPVATIAQALGLSRRRTALLLRRNGVIS